MNSRTAIKEIAQVIRGVSFDKGEAMDVRLDGYLPVLRAGNIDGELVTDWDLIWIPHERVAAEQRLKPGDIAICMSSGSPSVVGKTALLRSTWDGSVGAFCAIVRPRTDHVLPEYLAFFMQSELFRAWTRQSSGANIKNIRKTELEDFQLVLPSLKEQRRIVDLLSRAEGIARLRREAQKKAAEIIPALFLDMFGDPVTNPKGWPETQLGTLAEVQGGLQLSKARASLPLECPYLRVANVHRSRLDLSEVKTMHMTDAEFARTKLVIGDMLVVEGHGNANEIGRVAVWDGSIEGCVHQNHLIRVRCNAQVIKSEFACEYLNSASGRQSLLRSGKTTSGLNTISISNVRSASMFVPPVGLQDIFVERLTLLRSVATQQSLSLQRAESNFSTMLEHMFVVDSETFSKQVIESMVVV